MKQIVAEILQYALMVLGLAAGWLGFSYINQVTAQTGSGFLWILAVILVTIAAVAVGLFSGTILHEAGHLVGGLLTGWRFVLYYVFNFAIIKENGKLVRKNYRAPGTGGGCMLSPPNMRNYTYPHKLYICGGFLANFLVSALCLGLFYYLAVPADFWARAFLVIGIVHAFFGILNFIPQKATLPSDGYLLFCLGNEKNTATRRGMWSCFRMQELDTEGVRARDIPTELFDWVVLDDVSDMFVFGTICKRHEYLLDRKEFDEASVLMQTLHDNSRGLPGTMRMSCYCELLFHELIGECRQDEIDRLYTKELQAFIKAVHTELSVQRLMYAYARLVSQDDAKAAEHLELFQNARASSIFSGSALGEKELIELIDTIADKREKR